MTDQLDVGIPWLDARLDICDVYLFRSHRGTVLVMDVDPLSGYRGFHPHGRYEFKLDLDGDGVEDVTYCFTFDEADSACRQRWSLRRCDGACGPATGGTVLLTGVTGEVRASRHGTIRALAGPAADPFYIEGSVLTSVKSTRAGLPRVALEDFVLDESAHPLDGTDVGAIVLEVADDVVPAGTFGFWGATLLSTASGPLVMSMSAVLGRRSGCGLGAR
jgi:Domain of unknown function (DUF4331)